MPTDSVRQERDLSVNGSFRIECDDLHFDLRFTPDYFVADFPTFGMLLRAKSMKKRNYGTF